jgi:MoxR-like ATPase
MGVVTLRTLAKHYLGPNPAWAKMDKAQLLSYMTAGMRPVAPSPVAALTSFGSKIIGGENPEDPKEPYAKDKDGKRIPPKVDTFDAIFNTMWNDKGPGCSMTASHLAEARRHVWDEETVTLIKAAWDARHVLGGLKPLVLVGEAGCGKSAAWRAFCWRTNRPFYRVSLGVGTTQDDLIGRWCAKDGATVWVDGVVTRAAREGAVLILEEVDSPNDGITASMYSVLEPSGELLLKEKDGEIVHPADGFQVLGTANSFGAQDEAGRYTHSQVVSAALRSRFWGHVMPRPTPSKTAEILQNWGIPADVAVQCSKAIQALGNLVQDGAITSTAFGTREAIGWALAALAAGEWEKGLKIECGCSLSPGEMKTAWEAASRCVSNTTLKECAAKLAEEAEKKRKSSKKTSEKTGE